MLKYLLDTNIVIYVIKQRPIEALKMFNKQQGRMAIFAITLAELVHGAEKSRFTDRNLAVVEDFCSPLNTYLMATVRLITTAVFAQFWSRPVKPSA
jgi:tRNA(fMet)-specific endonuclease VapC